MKKIIAVILALTMLLALAACTAKTETTTTDTAADAATTTDTAAEQPADTEAEQPTDTNGDVTTITLAMHVSNTQEQEPAVYQAIQAFQQENPDVKIELVEHLTEEHNKQLKLWAQSGERRISSGARRATCWSMARTAICCRSTISSARTPTLTAQSPMPSRTAMLAKTARSTVWLTPRL